MKIQSTVPGPGQMLTDVCPFEIPGPRDRGQCQLHWQDCKGLIGCWGLGGERWGGLDESRWRGRLGRSYVEFLDTGTSLLRVARGIHRAVLTYPQSLPRLAAQWLPTPFTPLGSSDTMCPWFSAQCCLFPLSLILLWPFLSCGMRGCGCCWWCSPAGQEHTQGLKPDHLTLSVSCVCWGGTVGGGSTCRSLGPPLPNCPKVLCLCPQITSASAHPLLLEPLQQPPVGSLLPPLQFRSSTHPSWHQTTFSFRYLFLATLRGMWNFSNHESNPRPLQWKHGILTTGPPETLLNYFYTYNFLALITFTMLSNHHHHLQNTCITQPENLKEWTAHSPTPQPLVASHLLSISVDLPVLDISCQYSHTICGFCVWLLSLSILFSKFFHVVAWISIPFLFISI